MAATKPKVHRKKGDRGASKKEAFHQVAESKVKTFTFDPSRVPGVDSNLDLADNDHCNARIQILKPGKNKRGLHYHPNQDQFYMVLKGRVRYYGPDDEALGELGPMEGIFYPENARYWMERVGPDEAWLIHFSVYPKGADAAKAVGIEKKSKPA
jgi:hypothetical protein